MSNIIATIPKNKFKDWATAERVCSMCDGTTPRRARGFPEETEGVHDDDEESEWFWLINMKYLPLKLVEDSVCFMIYDGRIRGYFDIIKTDDSKNWGSHCDSLPERETKCVVMANWHPSDRGEAKGKQGWGYTELRP